jgi:hypothetical protein
MAVKKTKEPTKAEVTESRYKAIPNKVEKVSQELSCKLNDVEWNNRAQGLADAHKRTESEKQRKKDVMAEINADVKSAESAETKLANIVATRREQREVIVEVTHDYVKGIITKRRTDTDEQIDSREMTTTERQQSLFENEAVDANDVIESRHEDA